MTKKRMYPVIHFEMPAKDNERAGKFYEDVFGWHITHMGPEMGGFSLAFTTETDPVVRMPKHAGAINGGFYKRMTDDDTTKLTILVDDIEEMIKKVKEAGGKFLPGFQGGEVTEIPGVGKFASFIDTEGNVVTINQDATPDPTPEQKALLS